eukprot:TRINITY_DN9964_c0_g1_i1.p1 TRINITY_DN9964_c0_g1~~TRINITY_DN9964_c0_g1_i1.p1  ORF type:complete len:611 (+),score=92.36 TRINITY_DN9964_c0_g1_i1:130-1962(+)
MSRSWYDDVVVTKVKRACVQRGNNGIRALVLAFRSMDADQDLLLSPQEFRSALLSVGVKLTDQELTHLVCAFDRNGDRLIGLSEFIEGITHFLSPRRRAVVEQAWQSLGGGEKEVPLEACLAAYCPAAHPLVQTGQLPVEEARTNFEAFFSTDSNPDGVVSHEEFVAFYAGVSSNVPDDGYFEEMVRAVWNLDPPLGETSFSATALASSFKSTYQMRRSSPSNGQPSKASMIRSTVGGTKVLPGTSAVPSHRAPPTVSPQLQSCYAPLQGVFPRSYDMSHLQTKKGFNITSLGTASGKAAPQRSIPQRMPVEHTPTPTAPPYETTYAAAFGAQDLEASRPALILQPNEVRVTANATTRITPVGIPVVDRVRDSIFRRGGPTGFRGLTRVLRIMDDNGNRMLDRYELTNGLQTYGIKLTSAEMDEVMGFFDQDGSGQIDITEFLVGIRGAMNERRRTLVAMAYHLLDRNGDESVTFEEVKSLYDVKNHPEVLKKEKTPQQVMRDFVQGWDKDSNGTITFAEFCDYYDDISAGIDDDDYFELMIRNAWHISGGTGICANTSCRRVLVIHTDGRQTVEEIKNDLGIGPNDTDLMLENLRQQGITDIKRITLSY